MKFDMRYKSNLRPTRFARGTLEIMSSLFFWCAPQAQSFRPSLLNCLAGVFSMLGACFSAAAQMPSTAIHLGQLIPQNPTSADDIRIIFANRACGNFSTYTGDSYKVSMSGNSIRIVLGELSLGPGFNPCPPSPPEEVYVGRLPAGDYTLTVVEPTSAAISIPAVTSTLNFPFKVTDARALKSTPYVRSDYSGHWWDPADSGWGLFIWQDAKDNMLVAWFTYSPDGKPAWYVFQPTWETSTSTRSVPMQQTQRPPGTSSPPPGATSLTVVGSAKLSFDGFQGIDAATLTYKFGDGPEQVRNIRKFKP